MRQLARVSLPVLCLVAFSAARSFASPTYSVESLGALGSGPAAISAGSVGYYTSAAGSETPAGFSASGVTALPGTGMASGANSSGLIIGTTYLGDTPYVTEWINGQPQTYGLSGFGNAVNGAGQVAGGYYAGSNLDSFIWTGSTIHDIGGLGGSSSSVTALNASGEAAGNSTLASGSNFHSFFWDGYSMHDLGTLGGANSYASGINDQGMVVGAAQTSSGNLNAFLWNGSGLLDLGTLGGSSSSAYGVNDSGAVVGDSLVSGDGASHAFLDAGGVMVDLNSLLPTGSDWTITGAYSIDDQGDILGTALLNGSNYAVELYQNPVTASISSAAVTGIPEPGATALTGLAFLSLIFLGRKEGVLVRVRNRKPRHGKLQ